MTLSFTIFSGQKNYNRAHMLFQVLCGFEPIFYTTHPNEESFFYATAYYYNAPKWQKIKFFIHIFSPHTLINFSYIQKSCSNRYSPVVAAELSLLHVTVLDSGFATLCFHKCALMVNNFIEFAHFCQYIFLDKMLNCQLQHHFCKFCFIYC